MARADLILTLVKASRQGDDLKVRKAVEALAAEERAKNHTILADRLMAQLQSDNGRYASGLSFAEVEDFGVDVLRQITLQQPAADVKAIVERRLRHWRQRYTAHE